MKICVLTTTSFLIVLGFGINSANAGDLVPPNGAPAGSLNSNSSQFVSVPAQSGGQASSGSGETRTGLTTAGDSPPHILPTTSRLEAANRAKVGAGRDNPFAPLIDETNTVTHAPSSHTNKRTVSERGFVPPPPPVTPRESLTMPPLPDRDVLGLPEPPDKPFLADKLKLVGVLGERAVFVFSDQELRRINKWPANLALGPGDQFDSVNVVSVDEQMVTLEEDGRRSVKELETIR